MPTSTLNGFHESEEGYRLLFESNPQPMWIYDRETLAFIAVNEAAIQHYGYSPNEFLRMTIRDIRPSEDVAWLLEKVSEIKPGMNSASGRHLKKDGTMIDIEIVSHTLQFDGRRAELVLAMDVTERRTTPVRLEEVTARQTKPGVDLFEDDQLTDAEERIARCVARGFSNKQIAAALGLSVRTIENHISHILMKKSFSNRVELARYVFERDRAG